MAEIRFLEQGEGAELPQWAGLLPQEWQKKYIERKRPYRIRAEEGKITAVLQTAAEHSMEPVWRDNAAALLQALQEEGVAIVIPPMEGELQGDILPLATGRRLANLFAFTGAAEALRRLGKNPAECLYLLAGGDAGSWHAALCSVGNEVNRLAVFTAEPRWAEPLAQELLEEWGLMTEVFASPKNPALGQADVVLCCGMEQRAYSHMLKEGAVFIDLAGNRPVLRELMKKRPDIIAVDGFFFRKDGKQTDSRRAEAETFLSCDIFREKWAVFFEKGAEREMAEECKKMGAALSGFSLLGKRVKICRKP